MIATIEIMRPIIKQVVEEVIPLHRFLNFQLLELEADYAKILVPFRDELIGDPRSKRWHGGIIATALDSVGGTAGMTRMTHANDKLATIDMRVDYLRGAGPKDLIVEGRIVRSGNRILVTTMRAWHPESKNEILAEAKGVYNVRRFEDKLQS